MLLLTTRCEAKEVPQDVSVVKSLQKSNWSLTINGEKKKTYGISNTKTSSGPDTEALQLWLGADARKGCFSCPSVSQG